MAPVVPIIAGIGAAVAPAAAAIGSFAAAAAPVLGVVSAGLGIAATIKQNKEAKAIQKQESEIISEQIIDEREQIQETAYTGQVNAQDQGFAAAEQKAQLILQQAASGFTVSSPAFRNRVNRLAILAAQDQTRIQIDANKTNKAAFDSIDKLDRSRPAPVTGGALRVATAVVSGVTNIANQQIKFTQAEANKVQNNG